jgi:hypothetical protein
MSKRRLVVCLALFLCVVATVAVSAFAYADNYVTDVTWGPGSQDNSPYDYNWTGQATYFDQRYGGSPYLGTAYIDSTQTPVDSWDWNNTGGTDDLRDWYGYAAGACRASGDNNYSLYVYYCYAQTG